MLIWRLLRWNSWQFRRDIVSTRMGGWSYIGMFDDRKVCPSAHLFSGKKEPQSSAEKREEGENQEALTSWKREKLQDRRTQHLLKLLSTFCAGRYFLLSKCYDFRYGLRSLMNCGANSLWHLGRLTSFSQVYSLPFGPAGSEMNVRGPGKSWREGRISSCCSYRGVQSLQLCITLREDFLSPGPSDLVWRLNYEKARRSREAS